MYLAVTLARLEDIDNACAAYEKAIEMESDHLFHLNYSITLFNAGAERVEKAKHHFSLFERLFMELDEDARKADRDVLDQRLALAGALGVPLGVLGSPSPGGGPPKTASAIPGALAAGGVLQSSALKELVKGSSGGGGGGAGPSGGD